MKRRLKERLDFSHAARYGIALSLVSIAAMSSIFPTMQAGAALRGELHLQGEAAAFFSAEGRQHQKHPPQPDWSTADALEALST